MAEGVFSLEASLQRGQLQGDINALEADAVSAMREATAEGVDILEAEALRQIPRDTGRTASEIGKGVEPTPGGATGRVFIEDEIGCYLEFGTAPHIIRPRNARALFWPGARHPVLEVHHPGTRAYNWLRNSGYSTETEIEHVYERRAGAVFGGR